MTANETLEAEFAFADLHLRAELQSTLAALGYEEPTPIQREAIPPMLAGRDILGQAATGTGKTAAFALPMLERLKPGDRGKNPTGLVLVPTRELAMQVSEAIHRYGRDIGVRVVPVYGGQPIVRQLDALRRGVDIVVATPGRAVDHLNRKTLRLNELEVVVLDEADEMLDMGFAEELETILESTPSTRQTVLFSATLPARLNSIARRHLKDPERVEIAHEQTVAGEAPRVRQVAYVVARAHKASAIGRIIDVEAPAAAIVFCRTREQVDQLTESLSGRGYRAEALHGGMNQEQRDRVMGKLRKQTADLLIATDVAARGLDVDHLTHVINYDVPSSPEIYVHRIGRVGRAGREGCAITLAEPREYRMLKTIERVAKSRIDVEKLPTIAEVQSRRLDVTSGALREIILTGELEKYGVVVESLTDEFDIMQVALAAVKFAHESTAGPDDERDIPEHVIDLRDSPKNGQHDGKPGNKGKGKKGAPRRSGPTERLFVGAGRALRIRPQDLVGAIANETSLSGRDIGDIQIAEKFSLVEVPASSVAEVIDALRQTTIKGKKVTVRREKAR